MVRKNRLSSENRVKEGSATGRRTSFFLRALLPPVAIYILLRAFLIWPAATSGYDSFRPGNWRRYDSGHYLSIARKGYELFSCADIGYSADEWCGTTGWLPGYPYLIRFTHKLGISWVKAAVIVSGVFHFLTLALIWIYFLEAKVTRANLLALSAAAFFPGAIYYHSIYPISLIAFLTALWLTFLSEKRWVMSGIAGGLAAFTYPSSLLLAPIAVTWTLLQQRRESFPRILGPATLTGGLTAAGFGCALLLHHVTVGAWDAFFKVQQKYGHSSLENPMSTFVKAIRPIFKTVSNETTIPAAQTLLVAIVLVIVMAALMVNHRKVTTADKLMALYVMVMWLFPFLIGRHFSLFRMEALIFPLAILSRHLPWPVQAIMTGLFISFYFHMSILFFQSHLV